MVTLGIDASTTTIGWSFFSNEILDCGFVDIKKLETNKEKSYEFIDHIKTNSNFKNCDNIILEAALSGYVGGFTSQQTIIKLTRWNAVFEYILREEFPEKNIHLESVNTIRKNVFGKCRIKGIKPKEFVKFQLESKVPDLDKHIVYNKKGNVDKRTEDIFDAIVCSMFKLN
jgi:hypothetical protein